MLAMLHALVAHSRQDAIHHLTTHLVRTYCTAMGVCGWQATAYSPPEPATCRCCHGAVAAAGLHERMVRSWLIEADTFYSSSKRCSQCVAVKAALLLGADVLL